MENLAYTSLFHDRQRQYETLLVYFGLGCKVCLC